MKIPKLFTDATKIEKPWVGVEYSSVNPFNCDNTRVILIESQGFVGLYDIEGKRIKTLDRVNASSEPRWSRITPDVFYITRGNEIVGYNCETGKEVIIKKFDEYIYETPDWKKGIHGMGESDISVDGRNFVLRGLKPNGEVEIFVYNMYTGEKTNLYKWNVPFDGLKLTYDNQIIRSDGGIYIGENRKLVAANGHACIVNKYLIWINAAENPVRLPDFQNGIIRVDLTTGEQVGLTKFPWDTAVHISAPVNKDFVIISTYGSKLANSRILKVNIFTKEVEVLTQNIASNVSTYEDQPKATINSDGTKIIYNGKLSGIPSVMMLELEPTPTTPAPIPPKPETPPTEKMWREMILEEGKEYLLRVEGGKLKMYERK